MFTRDGLFSFDGRIRRSDWWIGGLLVGLVGFMVLMAFRFATSGPSGPFRSEGGAYVQMVVELVLLAPFAWVQAALAVKRGHDLSIPAWPFIAFQIFAAASSFVPLALPVPQDPLAVHPITMGVDIAYWIGMAVSVIALGFIPGTVGTNRYGSSTFDINKPALSEPGGVG